MLIEKALAWVEPLSIDGLFSPCAIQSMSVFAGEVEAPETCMLSQAPACPLNKIAPLPPAGIVSVRLGPSTTMSTRELAKFWQVKPLGGTSNGDALAVAPPEEVIEIEPETVPDGTGNDSAFEAVTVALVAVAPNITVVAFGAGSKLTPATLIEVPATPQFGLTVEMIGAPYPCVTTNDEAEVTAPEVTVTAIGPVVAPAGTNTDSCVYPADVTVAGTPLKVT